MIINQRLAEFLDVVILAVLLCQLAHLHFSEIAFDSLFQKGLTGLFRRISSRSEKGRNSAKDVNYMTGSLCNGSSPRQPYPPERVPNFKHCCSGSAPPSANRSRIVG
jgi:hypothetical protein